jgi:hypothetical protein
MGDGTQSGIGVPNQNQGSVNTPFAIGGGGGGSQGSLGTLFGIPAGGSVSPQEASWVGFTGGENVEANQRAYQGGTGQSTMSSLANVGAMAGDMLQTQRINDAMKAAAQQFANAQKGAIGSALAGAGSALGGITRLAGI